MNPFRNKKLASMVLGGILMPVFLFGSFAQASDEEIIPVVFTSNNITAVKNQYQLAHVKQLFGGPDLPSTYSAATTASEILIMRQDPSIGYVELDLPIKASEITVTEAPVPNDQYFTTDDLDENKQWYLPKIKLPEAWQYGTGSSSVKVAVIDTGIHAGHLEFGDGRVIKGYNVITGESIPANFNSDDNGHGTAVSGVIGAQSNNGKGLAGINWEVSLIPVKALSADGSGAISDVAAGIVWAADHDADIINLSLGGPGFGNDQTLNNSIIYAYNKGALIVSAAGNDLADHGISLDTTPVYPICADGGNNMVIGVAASDINDQKASFSNYGVNCVDIMAPGKKILTAAYLPSDPSDNFLIYGSGTSLAAPIVSGVAALLKADNPSFTNSQIKNIILNTADNVDALNQGSCVGASCNGYIGKGRINALSALSPQPLLDGTLVRDADSGLIYLINGGKKSLVTDFVFNLKGYSVSQVINEQNNQLSSLPNGTPLPPPDGLLLKNPTQSIVYYTHQGVKRPLTFLVFQSRNFDFAKVQTIAQADINAIPTGEWYWPPDGTMVLIQGDPTVYVMSDGVKRPVTYFVFIQRKLSFANVVSVTSDEFSHIPKAPDDFWMPPLDGSLVKSDNSPAVYLIFEGAKRPLTYQSFIDRKLSFGSIKTLPQAEIDVIAPGGPINN